jgi:hypothetical protein
VDRHLAARLTALAAHDLQTRQRLADEGSLFDGYHPEMQAVHETNARELETIIAETQWPIARLVGEDGADAAWLIAQHAIGLPQFQRKCLALLKTAVAAGQAPAWQMAMMLDRVRTLEGRLQVYGTQFDWDDSGELSPLPIEDLASVDQRRKDVGLEPLEVAIARHRAQGESQPRPAELAERKRRMDEWARLVGWR